LPSAGPLCLDFDFRYNTDIEERQHDESDIQNIIELYMNEIKCLLNISSNTKIPIFVFEKDDVNLLENITQRWYSYDYRYSYGAIYANIFER